MNKDSLLYPTSIMTIFDYIACVDEKYFGNKELDFIGYEEEFSHAWFPFALLVIISPYLYVCDLIGNTLDWLSMKYFVDFPLWAYKKMDEHEAKYGVNFMYHR